MDFDLFRKDERNLSGLRIVTLAGTNSRRMNLDENVDAVRASYDADLIVYAGPVRRPYDDHLIKIIEEKKAHENVVFWLTTFGGDPTAAYRIARALRKGYKKITMYVNSSCYSAGTLLALSAHAMIIDRHAEFGPIDVQLSRRDEIGERISGLTSRSALSLATDETPETFHRIFARLRRDIGLSTKLAADVAASLTDSTIGKLFQQIDPMRLAEDGRSVKVIESYAERIASENVREGAIEALVNSYPDHAFVIDPDEARERIFKDDTKPTPELLTLGKDLKAFFSRYLYESEPAVIFLDATAKNSDSTPPERDPTHEHDTTIQSNEDEGGIPSSKGEEGGPTPSDSNSPSSLH